jgi:O-antigen ligase
VRSLGVACLLAWAGYFLVAPTVGFGLVDSWHNEQRIVQLVLLAVSCVVLALRALVLPLGAPSWLLLGVLALGLASATLAEYPIAAFGEVGLMVQLAALAVLAREVVADAPALAMRWVLRAALLIGAAHGLGIATRCFAALQLAGPLEPAIFMLGYANPRFPSALYMLLMPLIAAIAIDGSYRRSLRVAAVVGLGLLWFANIGLGTRGVWFAFALALPVGFSLCGVRRTLPLAKVLLLTALGGALAYAAFAALLSEANASASLLQAVPEGLRNLTITRREVLWNDALATIAAHPFLGIGPMQLAARATEVGAHPHNWPLQVAAEWGLPAFVLLALWLAGVARRLLRTVREAEIARGAESVFVAVLLALALGLVDGNLVMPVSQSATALALGALLGSIASCSSSSAPRHRFVIAVLLASATFATAVFAIGSLDEQASLKYEHRLRHGSAWLTPRFWEMGVLRNYPAG